MADFFSSRLTGLGDVLAELKAIPADLRKNGGPVREGLAAAARVVRDQAKEDAPKDTGDLSESIIMIRDKNPRRTPGASERYVIGVKGGGRGVYADNAKNRRKGKVGQRFEKSGQAYYFRFVELGTEKMPARPFMRQAMAKKAEAAIDIAAKRIGSGIMRRKKIARARQ